MAKHPLTGQVNPKFREGTCVRIRRVLVPGETAADFVRAATYDLLDRIESQKSATRKEPTP